MPASENSKMLPDIIFQAHSTAAPPEDLQVIFPPKGKNKPLHTNSRYDRAALSETRDVFQFFSP